MSVLNIFKKKKGAKIKGAEDNGKPTKSPFKKAIIPEPAKPPSELKKLSILENITNEGIQFHNDHFEMQTAMGTKKFGRSFYIKPSGYPSKVRINWLENLFAGDDMDVSVHIEPFERPEANRKLKSKIDGYEAVIESAYIQKDHRKIEEVRQNLEDAKKLRDEIKSNSNSLFYVSISASVFADSLYELNQKCVNIESILSGDDIEIVNAFDRQREGWLSTLPLGSNYLKDSYRNLDRNPLTALFPHKSSKLNHTGGMPIGIYGREYVFFNNFDRKLNNFNLGIFGESGAGKGVMVKQIIGRGFSDGIEKVVILDVEPEYRGITEALGGINIDIRSDHIAGSSRINALDIHVEREVKNRYQRDEYIVDRVNVSEKIKEVIELVKIMKQTVSPDKPNLTPHELSALDRILKDEYGKRNITEAPESLYNEIEIVEGDNVRFDKKYKEMPTISSVKEQLQHIIFEENEDRLKELLDVIHLFTKGQPYGMFDCQTEIYDAKGNLLPIDYLDKSPIVNFDISKTSENSIERPLAQHIIMTWVWNRFIKNDPKPKKRVIQDEAWMMLKYPAMMDYFKLISARGRKWNVSLTLVSQRFEMFDRSEEAQDVLAQLNSVIFMKMPAQDIDPIMRTFRFSDQVASMIRTADTGDAIMKAGKEIVYFRSTPAPSEWEYLNTNQNRTIDEIITHGR